MTVKAPRPAYAPRECTCGHRQGEHQSNGTSFPHPLLFGVCLVPGCGCKEFTATQEEAA